MELKSEQAAAAVPDPHITFSSFGNSRFVSDRHRRSANVTILLAFARQSFSFGLFNS
jgi:hypothetical protein